MAAARVRSGRLLGPAHLAGLTGRGPDDRGRRQRGPPSGIAPGTAGPGRSGPRPTPRPGLARRCRLGGPRRPVPGDDLRRGSHRTGGPPFLAGRLQTLAVPGEHLLCRFATVSDVHIGERRFGVMGRIHDALENPGPTARGQASPIPSAPCGRPSTKPWTGAPSSSWPRATSRTGRCRPRCATAARILSRQPGAGRSVPRQPRQREGVNSRAILGEGLGRALGAHARDLPGVRLVLVNTVHGDPRYHRGQLPAEIGRRAVRCRRSRPAPSGWPCTTRPSSTGSPPSTLPVCRLAKAATSWTPWRRPSPRAFVTCGHRHRNRRYDYGPIVVSEVGDQGLPGRVGRLQGLRRRSGPGRTPDSRPDVISWTEATRRAMNGQWHRWSPGRLDDRCFAVG